MGKEVSSLQTSAVWIRLNESLEYDIKSYYGYSKINDLDAVKSYYGYSNEKLNKALKILTKEQISFIKEKLDVGGKR